MQYLSQVAFRPFDITLMGTGCFPDPRTPYVLWAGVQYHPVLRELYDAVQEELNRAGVPEANRTFHPHVTLGRIKKVRSNKKIEEHAPLDTVMDHFLQGPPRQIQSTFHVGQFQLFHSRMHSGGAIHHCMQDYRGS